jgi:hypothetical protein
MNLLAKVKLQEILNICISQQDRIGIYLDRPVEIALKFQTLLVIQV